MIEIGDALIRNFVIYNISDNNNVNSHLHETCANDVELFLKRILLNPFLLSTNTFEFYHDIALEYNVLFNLCKNIYEEADFIEISNKIYDHLLSVSDYTNINAGQLFIAKFSDLKFNNTLFDGIGIYKFENKESFIETFEDKDDLYYYLKQGIGTKKPEKACLILFTEEPFTLFIIDNNADTAYWNDAFINRREKNDFINKTLGALSQTKKFVINQIPTEFNISKADQIDLLNRSLDYFKKHEIFNKAEFEKNVFNNDELINSFRNFSKQQFDADEEFQISPLVVKKQSKIFKNVLKLDRNFHIYIHGNRDLIEQGVDELGRKYYKIYYENEL